mgnify:CR=1 FL=1
MAFRLTMKTKVVITALVTAMIAVGLWVVPSAVAATNLIANPSMETAAGSVPAGWFTDVWGTNTSTFTHATNGRTGSRSVLVTMTQRTSGDAKWLADPVAVTPGATYSYSDFYISGVTTQVYAMYIDAAGNYDVRLLANAPASASWRQFSATFTTPSTAARLIVSHVLPAVGSLQLDDVSGLRLSE